MFVTAGACALRSSRTMDRLDPCGAIQWTVPQSVVDSEWAGQFPSIAMSGDQWVVAADEMARFDRFASLPAIAIARGAISHTLVGIRGGFFPRLRRDPAVNSYSLLWGQADTSQTPFVWPPRVTDVYSASVTTSGQREGSRRIYSASEVAWDPRRSSSLTTDGSGGLAIAFAAYKKGVGSVVAVLVRRSGVWRISEVRTSSMASYVDVVFSAPGSLVVAFVAPVGGSAIDINSVWTMRSLDDATTWSTPTLIMRSGVNPASYVRLAQSGGVVHLVWGRGTEEAMDPSVMVHSQSQDRGRTWSAPAEAKLGRSFANLRAVATDCALHVVGDEYSGVSRTGSLLYAQWTGETVHVTRPHPDWRLHDPDIAVTPDGDILVVAPGQPTVKATPGFFTVVTRGLMRSINTNEPKERK